MPEGPLSDDLDYESAIALVDHHAHGVVTTDLDRDAFELLISESGGTAPPGTSHFEAPIGVSIRRWCAPVLGLEPNASPEDYVRARAALGPEEVNRRLLRRAGLELLVLDTGHRPDEVATPAEMAELSAVPVAEVVRVETVAGSLAGVSSGPGEWAARIKGALGAAAAGAVGLKTIVAYRYGLDLDPVRPSPPEVAAALDGWFRDSSQGGFRLTSPVLLRHLLHEALDLASSESLPFQVHAGFGDPDLTLHRSDPSLFTPWVRLAAAAGVDIVFLHCYPYHRQAGYLAEVFANCYFDVGCALNYTGPSAGRVLAEALEMAPFTKMLYSSDAFGLAELVYLGALQFRRHLAAILDGFVERGECGRDDARRITAQLAVGNARRIYPFERAADPKAPAFSSERSS